jgi:hypothetical protein
MQKTNWDLANWKVRVCWNPAGQNDRSTKRVPFGMRPDVADTAVDRGGCQRRRLELAWRVVAEVCECEVAKVALGNEHAGVEWRSWIKLVIRIQ